MMNNEYHKPFIKSLVFAAVVTLVAMFSTKYIVEIYASSIYSPPKTLEYSSQKSQDDLESR